MVKPIFFDEKYFEESGLIFWIFENGYTEYTNEEIHRTKIKVLYSRKITKSINHKKKLAPKINKK